MIAGLYDLNASDLESYSLSLPQCLNDAGSAFYDVGKAVIDLTSFSIRGVEAALNDLGEAYWQLGYMKKDCNPFGLGSEAARFDITRHAGNILKEPVSVSAYRGESVKINGNEVLNLIREA